MKIHLALAGFALAAVSPNAMAQPLEKSTPTVVVTDKGFVGHYYLSGVMETGSELLLKPDGTYQWVLMVGSLDLYSDGTWRTETGADKKQHVILTAKEFDTKKPPLIIRALEPWNEAAEENAQEDAMTERNKEILSRCKFLDDDGGEPFVDWALSLPYQEVNPKLIEQVNVAAKIVQKARTDYEIAAVNAMSGDGRDDDLHKIARTARLAWRLAYNKHAQAASDAKLFFKPRVEPVLPKQCIMEDAPIRPSQIDKSKWIGGVAVRIQNTQSGSYLNDVAIGFELESGEIIERTTRSGGIAWIPRTDDDRVTSIFVAGKNVIEPKTYKFPIPPTSQGYIPIEISLTTLAPFTEMRLEVSGRDLIGFDGRGRYSRN
jgi:hypothetical protein